MIQPKYFESAEKRSRYNAGRPFGGKVSWHKTKPFKRERTACIRMIIQCVDHDGSWLVCLHLLRRHNGLYCVNNRCLH